MNDKRLHTLCDTATEAHACIQRDFKEINPIVGVSQKMRDNGVPADVMTIDCLRSGKRIILVLHDQHQDIIRYQLSFIDKDPDNIYEHIQFNELTVKKLYNLIASYFSSATTS